MICHETQAFRKGNDAIRLANSRSSAVGHGNRLDTAGNQHTAGKLHDRPDPMGISRRRHSHRGLGCSALGWPVSQTLLTVPALFNSEIPSQFARSANISKFKFLETIISLEIATRFVTPSSTLTSDFNHSDRRSAPAKLGRDARS